MHAMFSGHVVLFNVWSILHVPQEKTEISIKAIHPTALPATWKRSQLTAIRLCEIIRLLQTRIPAITSSEIVVRKLLSYEHKSIGHRQTRRWKVYGNGSLLANQNIGRMIQRLWMKRQIEHRRNNGEFYFNYTAYEGEIVTDLWKENLRYF